MTNVIVNAIDVLGQEIDEGVVKISAADIQYTGGTLLLPEYHEQELVAGSTTISGVTPGKVVISIHWGINRTATFRVFIPDTDEITLADLSLQKYDTDPAIVSKVADASYRAEGAADRAEAAAAVVGDAQTVLTARDDTVQAVATLGDAQTVLTARDQAVTAAGTAEGVATALPTTIQSELDTRVPPLVADTIAADQTIVDAAAAAVGPLAQGAVDAAADAIKWIKRPLAQSENLDQLITPGLYQVPTWTVATSLVNRPTVGLDRATIEVKSHSSGAVEQVWTTHGLLNKEAPVMRRRRDETGSWTAWTDVTTVASRDVSDATLAIGLQSDAGKVVRLGPDGKLLVATATITSAGDVTNKQYVDGKVWSKRAMTTGEDLNALTAPGLYTADTWSVANSLVNRPSDPSAVEGATIEVQALSSGKIAQVWRSLGSTSLAPVEQRRTRLDTGVWSVWKGSTTWVGLASNADRPLRTNAAGKIAISTASITDAGDVTNKQYVDGLVGRAMTTRDPLTTGTDLNAVTINGIYPVPTWTVASSLVNRPDAPGSAIARATLTVVGNGAGGIRQDWDSFPPTGQEPVRMTRERNDGLVWSEWRFVFDPHQALGITSKAAEGDIAGLRTVLREISGQATPVWSWWAPPGQALKIPTHEGSGQAVHPSVLHFPSGWGGYRYWMAHTPYPYFQEGHEDPNIVASQDGTTWEVPAGLTNPLDDQAGSPSPHNSDTHLVMLGDTMVMTWRMVDRPSGNRNIIKARTSTDGVTWTPGQEVLALPATGVESGFMSQSLIKMPTGWRMYGVRSSVSPYRLSYYDTTVETVPTTTDWGPVQDATVTTIAPGRHLWHADVQRLGEGDWLAVFADRPNDGSATGDIYLATSTDGVAWNMSPLPLTPRGSATMNSLYKTGFVASGTGAARSLDLWISGYRVDTGKWGVVRTTATRR